MAEQGWKHAYEKFPNMKIDVQLETKADATPWTPIFQLIFKLKPTPYAEQAFDEDIHKFHKYLADEILGLKIVKKKLERLVPSNWQMFDVYYAYEHQPRKFTFGKQSDFQLDVYIIAPSKYEQAHDWKGLKKEISVVAKKLAKADIFQNSKLLQFKA